MNEPREAALVRALGVRQLAAGIVNATVGSGIFVLPALVSQGLGGAAPVAFLVCALAMALVVTTFALAGSRVSLTGGLFAYIEVAFGPFVGFLAGVLQWAVFLFAVSAVAAAFLDQLTALVPPLESAVSRTIALAAVLAVLAAINARGIRSGARTVEVLSALKIGTLLLFAGLGVSAVNPSWIAWPGMPDPQAIGRASLILIFAFQGVEVALAPSGEIRNPARTVPLAIYLALGITTMLYAAVQLVAQGVLGPELARHTQAPIADAAAVFLGPGGRVAVLFAALVSMFGYISGDMLSSPRNLYAFARDGFLPAAFAAIHPTRGTPQLAIWTHALCVFLLASTSTFTYLVAASSVGTLILYMVAAGASSELVRRDVRAGGIPFNIPGARIVPIGAVCVLLWMTSTAKWQEFATAGGIIAFAVVAYALRQRVGVQRRAERLAESRPV